MKETRDNRRHNLLGQKFGMLTVIKRGENDKNNHTTWICKCDCGNIKQISANNLRTDKSKSCGCRVKESARKRFSTHGETKTRLYKIWAEMKSRCYNPYSTSYKNYGARGITVDVVWKDDFISFKNWAIENGYSDELTIDRIDVNGNYEPSNCRWATYEQQANNKRNNHLITYNNETHTIAEWSRITNIKYDTIERRINRSKWSVEKALTYKDTDMKG